jgi:glycosyltransferase involved in cell wall biosynthesis
VWLLGIKALQVLRMNTADEKSLKIIFVIRYFYPFIGGLEKKALNLAAALVQRGVRVEIVTSRFFNKWPQKETIQGIPIYRLPSPRIKIAGAFIYLFSLCSYIFNNRKNICIIHAFQVGYSSALAVFMGRLFNKPTILNLAGSGGGGDICRHRSTPWGRVFLFFCCRALRIVIVNQEMYRELKTVAYDVRSIVRIPNGVDLKTFKPAENRDLVREKMGMQGKTLILYTGRLSREKGLDFLIRVFSKLAPEEPAILYIIGDGPERSRLQNQVRNATLENAVHIRKAVNDVVPFLQAADIFIMPSWHEGLSNSILEAMACGLPVIATRVEGNAELIEHGVNGLLVAPGNDAQLVTACLSLISDSAQARALGQNAQKTVHGKYTMEQVVEQYITLYTSIRHIR